MECQHLCRKILLGLNQLRLRGELCDAQLLVDNVFLSAHRVVLAATSPFFRRLYLGQCGAACQTFKLDGISKTDMLHVLDFLYTGQLPLTASNVKSFSGIAEQLDIPVLLEHCQSWSSGKRQLPSEAWSSDHHAKVAKMKTGKSTSRSRPHTKPSEALHAAFKSQTKNFHSYCVQKDLMDISNERTSSTISTQDPHVSPVDDVSVCCQLQTQSDELNNGLGVYGMYLGCMDTCCGAVSSPVSIKEEVEQETNCKDSSLCNPVKPEAPESVDLFLKSAQLESVNDISKTDSQLQHALSEISQAELRAQAFQIHPDDPAVGFGDDSFGTKGAGSEINARTVTQETELVKSDWDHSLQENRNKSTVTCIKQEEDSSEGRNTYPSQIRVSCERSTSGCCRTNTDSDAREEGTEQSFQLTTDCCDKGMEDHHEENVPSPVEGCSSENSRNTSLVTSQSMESRDRDLSDMSPSLLQTGLCDTKTVNSIDSSNLGAPEIVCNCGSPCVCSCKLDNGQRHTMRRKHLQATGEHSGKSVYGVIQSDDVTNLYCLYCPRTGFNGYATLLEHVKKEHKFRSHQCPKCHQLAPSKSRMDFHMEKCEGEQAAMVSPMSEPGESLPQNTQQNLGYIYRVKRKTGPDGSRPKLYARLYCPVCPFTMTSTKGYQEHVVGKHGITDPDIIGKNTFVGCCEFCPYMTVLMQHLTRHRREHRRDGTAIRSAAAKKALRCSYCNFSSSIYMNMKLHQYKVHNKLIEPGSQIFNCPKCSFSTLNRGDLSMHTARVHGERKFRCAMCGSCFTTKLGLQAHIHVHSPKRFKCMKCNYIAKRKAHLRSHMENKHSQPSIDQLYVCECCGCTAKSKTTLTKHREKGCSKKCSRKKQIHQANIEHQNPNS